MLIWTICFYSKIANVARYNVKLFPLSYHFIITMRNVLQISSKKQMVQSWGKCFFLKIPSVTNYYQLHTCQKVNGEQFILVKKWYYSINFICVFDHLVYFGKHVWSISTTNCLAIVYVLLTQNMHHIFSQMIRIFRTY